MTTTHQQHDEASKQAARLRSLADQVAQPAVAGKGGGKALKAKHRNDWRRITEAILPYQSAHYGAQHRADMWKQQCQFMGIGTGLFANWLFWNWAFPLLLELAKLWIESNKNQGPDSE